MDQKGNYDVIFYHIWVSASTATQPALERLDWLLKTEKYGINDKTLIGLNTPLHFAVINENLKAIELLCRSNEILMNERNAVGQTPSDLAMLIPKRKVSMKIIDYLNKKRK